MGLSELFAHSAEGTEFDPVYLRKTVDWHLKFGASRDNLTVWASTQTWAARSLAILGQEEEARPLRKVVDFDEA